MSTPRSQTFRFLGGGLVLVCISLSLIVDLPVRADVGVQPILPGGSNIKPEGETPIQMAAEKVVMTVRLATEADNAIVKLNPDAYGLQYYQWAPSWYPAVAEVMADFRMANPTSETVSMTAWFPLASALESVEWDLNPEEIVPRIEGFQVTVDGKAVDFNVSELPNPKGEDKPLLPWASFPVTFPAGEEALIQVGYVLPAWPTPDEVGMKLYYIFQTGAGWAGPIGKAELVVNLPFLASAETIGAMPEGGQAEGQEMRWTWENLEPGPQDDFSIWLLLPDRWVELQAARAAVKGNPEDGEDWLNLVGTYHRSIFGKFPNILPGFGETYQPLGVQAAQEALRLLPGDCRPHYELAMLYLSMVPKSPSLEALRPVLDELRIVEERCPALAPNVHDYLEVWLYNDATATAEAATWAAENATEAAKATLYNDATAIADAATWTAESATEVAKATLYNDATATADVATWVAGRPWRAWYATQISSAGATPTPSPTHTLTPIPSASLEPMPMTTPTPSQQSELPNNGKGQLLIVAGSLIVLIGVGYLVMKRMWSSSSK